MTAKPIFDLAGRVAIVTGGSVGLGRQMAEGLAEMGANLVLCARKKERCLHAAEELQKLGVKVLALGCDVKQPASVQESCRRCRQTVWTHRHLDQQCGHFLGRASRSDDA